MCYEDRCKEKNKTKYNSRYADRIYNPTNGIIYSLHVYKVY